MSAVNRGPTREDEPDLSSSRGRFLRTLGVGVLGAATAGAFATTETASAGVDGDVVLGSANTTGTQTTITVDGSTTQEAGLYVNVTDAATSEGIRGDSTL